MPEKPYSAACERNREPILAVLRRCFTGRHRVLEIGSGTGQHAVYFAHALPGLIWQTSDRPENLPGIQMWLDEAALPNTPAPFAFDVSGGPRPDSFFDAVFSANTLHIMGWSEVQTLFAAMRAFTVANAVLAIYGPFNYNGRYTSDSNAAFDASLRQRAPEMGIRDFESVDALADTAGFALLDDVPMPANNRTLIWRRRT